MKGKIKYELILIYNLGYKPKDIIKMGYKPSTAYNYHRIFKQAKERMKEVFSKRMNR